MANNEESLAALKGTVLVVDSSSEERKILAGQLLTRSGLKVIEARSAAEALEALAKQPVDAIISEVRMPVQDGLSLLREVRTHPRHGRLPFVLTGAVVPRDLKDLMRTTGLAGFLKKPLDPQALTELLLKLFTPAALPELSSLSILIADHLPSARKVLMRLLDGLGVRDIVQAADGKEALQIVEAKKPDIIIADRDLSEIDGVTLLAEIRKLPRSNAPGFVLVSTRPLAEASDPLSPLAQVPFLKKPFDGRTLQRKICEALERRI